MDGARSQYVILSAAVILVLLAVGCASKRDTSANNISTVPAASVTPDPMAPSYEAIQEGLDSITKTPEHPEGPAWGPDGLIDEQVGIRYTEYKLSLQGKKVENWEGWYLAIRELDPILQAEDNMRYRVSIAMKEPTPGSHYIPDVSLLVPDSASSDKQSVEAWAYGQRVVFSGTLYDLQIDGVITVSNATIEPVQP